jgi:hypothetical protein
MTTVVQAVVPWQSIIPPTTSTSQHILRKRQVEILPNEQTNFAYSTNDSIIFNISSSTEVLDGLDSFIKFGLESKGATTQALEVGGAHALFREMTLRTQNGTIIQRYANYNRLYALMSMATHSPQHVELVEFLSGDSVGDGFGVVPAYNDVILTSGLTPVAFSKDDATFDHAGSSLGGPRRFGLGDGSVAGDVAIGDVIQIVGTARYDEDGDAKVDDVHGTWFATVTNVTGADNNVIITIGATGVNNNMPPGGIAAGSLEFLYKVSASALPSTYQSQRASIAQETPAVTLCFKPMLSFLQQKTWIPLPFIKQGLQLEMKLERPEYVFNSRLTPERHNALNISATVGYTISKPRFVGMMITPNETLMREYLSQFNGAGLNMSFLSYNHNSRPVGPASGLQSINNTIGVRSARHAFAVLQSPKISQSTGISAQVNYSLSTFFRCGLKSYQFKSGSEQFPDRPVECDKYSNEAFAQLMLTTGQHGGTIWSVRFTPNEWRSENVVTLGSNANAAVSANLVNQSTKFIMSVRLDRNDDAYTGLDLSLNPLDIELNFETAEVAEFGENRILHLFVGYDTFVSISSNGLIVKK